MSENVENKVIQLLEEATLAGDEQAKVLKLKMAQELIVSNSLLDSFAETILDFQTGHGNAVRKFVIAFFEIVLRQKPELFPVITFRITMLLQDSVDDVVKRTIQACTQLYKPLLFWVASILNVKQEQNGEKEINKAIECFQTWKQIKETVLNSLDTASNDGVRTQAIKFIETCIILQTSHDETSANKADFSVDQLNFTQDTKSELFNLQVLEEESKAFFKALIGFQSEQHISSTNLTIVMLSLSTIARQRSKLFFNQVCDAYLHLCHNFPPTLGANHLTSVKKQLKLNLQKLLKHDFEFSRETYKKFVDMFTEMGISRSEIDREMSKKRFPEKNSDSGSGDCDIKQKRLKRDEKPPKVNAKDVVEIFSKFVNRSDLLKAQEMNAEDIRFRLSASGTQEVMIDLIKMLPPEKRNLSLSSECNEKEFVDYFAYALLTNGLGPGFEHYLQHYLTLFQNDHKCSITDDLHKRIVSCLKYLIHKCLHSTRPKKPKNMAKIEDASDEVKTKARFRFDHTEREKQTKLAYKRILSEKGIPEDIRSDLLVCSLKKNTFSKDVLYLIHLYIMQDLDTRFNIYRDVLQYFSASQNTQVYEDIFLNIADINSTLEKEDDKINFSICLFRSPATFTEKISQVFKQTILKSENLVLAEELATHVQSREDFRIQFLKIFLEICIETPNHAFHEFFTNLLSSFIVLPDCKTIIENFSLHYIKMLKFEKPESDIAGLYMEDGWTDVSIKRCLSIFLELLKDDIKYIHELPKLFAECFDDRIRKVILISIPKYVSSKDAQSSEILKFVESCPDGSEALVSTVISFMTENTMPSHELVEKMKERFGKVPSNIRYLIPVLCSFSKSDLIAVLPNLIKLNTPVLKQVYGKLLVSFGEKKNETHLKSPITPVDLLIALHNIDSTESDVRIVIKAINLCFDEQEYFSAETFAITMQQLVTINPLPQLLMRTVITVVKRHPQLIAFIMNGILPALIQKKIWTQKPLWNGFIRCCQATVPSCFALLAQLPIEQLNDLFETAPELRPQLQQYIRDSKSEAGFSKRHLDVIFKPHN